MTIFIFLTTLTPISKNFAREKKNYTNIFVLFFFEVYIFYKISLNMVTLNPYVIVLFTKYNKIIISDIYPIEGAIIKSCHRRFCVSYCTLF